VHVFNLAPLAQKLEFAVFVHLEKHKNTALGDFSEVFVAARLQSRATSAEILVRGGCTCREALTAKIEFLRVTEAERPGRQFSASMPISEIAVFVVVE
jgi:hypothetical protein